MSSESTLKAVAISGEFTLIMVSVKDISADECLAAREQGAIHLVKEREFVFPSWLMRFREAALASETNPAKTVEAAEAKRASAWPSDETLLARLESAEGDFLEMRKQLGRASGSEVAASLAKAVADRDVLQQNLDAATKIINELNDSVQSVVAERDKAISERDAHVERSIELATELESLRSNASSSWVVFGVKPTIVPGLKIFETSLWTLEIADRGELSFKMKHTNLNLNASFDPTVHFGPRDFEDVVVSLLKVHSEYVEETRESLRRRQ